jgi:fructose-1,6-bisphosphatase
VRLFENRIHSPLLVVGAPLDGSQTGNVFKSVSEIRHFRQAKSAQSEAVLSDHNVVDRNQVAQTSIVYGMCEPAP